MFRYPAAPLPSLSMITLSVDCHRLLFCCLRLISGSRNLISCYCCSAAFCRFTAVVFDLLLLLRRRQQSSFCWPAHMILRPSKTLNCHFRCSAVGCCLLGPLPLQPPAAAAPTSTLLPACPHIDHGHAPYRGHEAHECVDCAGSLCTVPFVRYQ